MVLKDDAEFPHSVTEMLAVILRGAHSHLGKRHEPSFGFSLMADAHCAGVVACLAAAAS